MTESEQRLWDEIVLNHLRTAKTDCPWRVANNVIRARRRLAKNLTRKENQQVK